MKIDLEKLIDEFNKNKFPGYYVGMAKSYGWDIAYIEIKTNIFNVALDIDIRGNIYLVFRDHASLSIFNEFLHRDFEERTMIYDQRNNKYELGTIPEQDLDTLSITYGAIRNIIEFYNDISVDYHNKKQLESSRNIESLLLQETENKTWNDLYHFFEGKRLSALETVKWIKENNCSLSRFGDGEIMLLTEDGIYFQKADKKLTYELRNICSTKNNTLVCMPHCVVERGFWHTFWVQYWFRSKFFINQPVYGDTFVSRPEGFYQFGDELVNAWMSIWENKNVCIVTGEKSRLDPEHLMLSNIKNKEIIYSGNTNSYDDIDSLTEKCLEKKDIDIFLIASGPAGTVLSAKLAGNNRIALDIGHLTNSYDVVYAGKDNPEQLPFC
ncbi:hypothetical protein CKG00_13570 [Morganella morganii]|uniref:Glycosyltransferase GT-D fold domain-containing protein n=1 Tax=Morganella morganii TaxID=582 RepID=A0A433ZYT1_MORMO|nr:GT-D fold domain-containing glycosyltransferase [Morganella morganii]RUT67279.1 hypothetical protein CKG00_13570 [Morganella morganii]